MIFDRCRVYLERTANGKPWMLGIIFFLLLFDRMNILFLFGTVFTGSDDSVLWMGAQDYANGIFREPYFYRQDYNVMLEALVAVPFLWIDVPHHIALPVSTTLLALFPFVLGAFLFHRMNLRAAAAIMLLVPLAMPVEYGMITTMSRGFVNGIAVASLSLFCLLINSPVRSAVLWGAVSSFALIINPNSVPIIVLTGCWLLVRWRIHLAGITAAIWAVVPAFVIQYFARSYYESESIRKVHTLMPLKFYPEAIPESFKDLDVFFTHLSPVFWGIHWLPLLTIPTVGILLYRSDRPWAIALLVTTLILVLALGMNKVHDGGQLIHYPRSRMFLAVPFLLAIALARIPWKYTDHDIVRTILIVSIALFGVKLGSSGTAVDRAIEVASEHEHLVHMRKLSRDCTELERLSRQLGAEVIVFHPEYPLHFAEESARAFACPLISRDLPVTFMTVADRRTWIYESVKDSVFSTIILKGPTYYCDVERPEWVTIECLADRTLLIRTPPRPLSQVLGSIGINVRLSFYNN